METVALTYDELADRLGIKVQSAKARARRNNWATTKGNGKGRKVLVQVPVDALDAPVMLADVSPDTSAHTSGDVSAHVTGHVTGDVVALRESIARLETLLDAERQRNADLSSQHEREVIVLRELVELANVRADDAQADRDRWMERSNRGIFARLFQGQAA